MILRHPAHPSRSVRLAYCLNLRECADVDALIALLRSIVVPLRTRLAARGPFGVGMYLPASLARALASPSGSRAVDHLASELEAQALDPFTWNAFPFGGFGALGLKTRVFQPSWSEPERLEFTVAVAHVAAALVRRLRGMGSGAGARIAEHVSISTHTGGWAAHLHGAVDREEFAFHQARAVDALARLEEATGVRAILALEPEPGANAADLRALDQHLAFVKPRARSLLEEERNRDRAHAADLVDRHLGVCLDTCHAAVEGEALEVAADLAAGRRASPAKLQYASALRVAAPGSNPSGVEALLALAEPRFLHQVRAYGGGERLAVDDLPDLVRELAGDRRAAWLAAREWLCHLHVPVDLETAGGGLGTTRADADRILASLLAHPERWATSELHVEIETYTWEALPGWVRGDGALVEGIEREYRHVLGELARAGWG
ncbi:MAG: hypothetical protein NTY35_12020 [Planctomycetota bacterium]|nr:hypothetical protein [Planctomycetota bacterium]